MLWLWKRKIGLKLLAQMHINCNALHYGPMAPLQSNLLTYKYILSQVYLTYVVQISRL